MAKNGKASSVTIYESIRGDIINRRLENGSALVEETLAEQYHVSRTPIRDALKLLEKDGLVAVYPYRGCFVRELTPTDIEEIYTIRQALEGICCLRAVQTITDENLAKLQENWEASMEAFRAGDIEKAAQLGDFLHEIILRVGGNQRIDEIMERMKAQTLQLNAISSQLEGRMRKSLDEHGAVIEALKRRDGPMAEQRFRAHIDSTRQDVLVAFRNLGVGTGTR